MSSNPANAAASGRNRIYYYDFLRFSSFAMVVWYHMLVQLYVSGVCDLGTVAPWYATANLHVATLAVSVFFMLSGAGLAISAERGFSLSQYCRKRFLRLLVPFYVTVLLYYLYRLAVYRSMPTPFSLGIPAWRYVFTLFGLDEWVSMHGYATFSCSIGEWFLGALVVLTVLFPLFRYLMNRWPKIFLTACTCAYVYVSCNYRSKVNMHMSLPLKGYEFILGMYFGKYFRRFPDSWKMVSAPIVVFFFFAAGVLDVNFAFKMVISAIAFFVTVSSADALLGKCGASVLGEIGKYLYEFYLVHHVVIYEMTPRFAARYPNPGRTGIVAFLVVELLAMAVLAAVVKMISDFAARGLARRGASADRQVSL